LILDRSIEAYVVMLAILKIEAAYVPLDYKFPSERIAFIAEDAGIRAFIVTAGARALVADTGLAIIDLAVAAQKSATMETGALAPRRGELPADRLCYIIYTSGSTGRPKGVVVNHSSICNFVSVAAEVYGYRPGDRVYQGMTLAFDFSVEELWVPLISGATLVPSPADRQMVGEELARFLVEKKITAMCCVPTLLATIDEDLPALRFLLVSGEACPQDIVARWHRPGRRMLNAYGPTEATVTATWTEVAPDKPVTIGVPLPTYTAVILETGRDALVGAGAVGEIAIAGIGLAVGYVNRDDLTAKAFVPDFLHLANNPSRRLYRTGDLGRINDAGEIEYLGRIDTQVKIRGYRIELAEIENVLLEIEGVAQAVATTHEAEPGLIELAAYYTCFKGGPQPSRERLLKVLRGRLPGYMVPAYLQELAEIPLSASHKADRKALPPPSGLRLVSSNGAYVPPRNETERVIAQCLAKTLKLEAVSVDDHFFDDLGAHSLLMGQFLATLNQRLPKAKAAISDVYLAPSVALLAAELDQRRIRDEAQPAQARCNAGNEAAPAHVASDFNHIRCGVLQALFYASQFTLYLVIAMTGVAWTGAAEDTTGLIGRAALFTTAALALMMAMPVAAKWLLIGRWKAERIPIWSVRYFRFWVVRQLVTMSPWVALRGSVLFNVYLRLLGAKIGDSALILCERFPLATDQIRIGDRSVLRKLSHVTGYRADNGYIEIGPVDIGHDVVVGEGALIDAGTAIGDGGQLGHASALLDGQSIPAGSKYHGSPAIPTKTDFRGFEDRAVSRLRRALFAAARLLLIIMAGAAGLALSALLASWASNGEAGDAVVAGAARFVVTFDVFDVVGTSLQLFLIGYAIVFLVHFLVPRMLRLMLVSGRVYPLYGPHHFAAELLAMTGHSPGLQTLFGDSSAIVHYFRWLGLRQPDVKQTGSNFGTATNFDSPFDVEVGSGSMISDGLSVVNFEMASGAFQVSAARIGARSFTGNSIIYPPNARVGDNCLIGTKTMVPSDGEMRDNVGLLGSPAFEIPREVVSAARFNPVPETEEERKRLRAKDWFNLRTAIFHLLSQWTLLFGILSIGTIGAGMFDALGYAAIFAAAWAAAAFVIAHNVVVDRLSLGGRRLVPHNCTIHEPHFWWVERHWKLGETWLKRAFIGTPFRPMLLRLVGLRVGRKVFDDGCMMADKHLVEIGDHCCLNAASSIQGHSLEDGLFKSDRIIIDNGCTIGPMGFVHYGVVMGDNTRLASDAFLMKGATTEPHSQWQGNPARPV
ncbi:MAG: amino acid adenylation domain-containing protein, partial [Alphaproteobacteria bacterium]|nr:amino acid adenylation domain-containing protein [Alphaproteobacteria bacterium]